MKSFKQHILEGGPLEKGLGTLLNVAKGDVARWALLGRKKKREKLAKEVDDEGRPVHSVARQVGVRAAKGWLTHKLLKSLGNKPEAAAEREQEKETELTPEEERNRAEKAKARRDEIHGGPLHKIQRAEPLRRAAE